MDRMHREAELSALVRRVVDGSVSRRGFLRKAAALGVALPAANLIFGTYRAAAQDASNPITVTIGGTPIAVAEEDVSTARKGGTFRFGRPEDSINLDPVTNDGNVNIWIFTNIYDTLLRVTMDGAALEPSLAESWEISEDGKVYTFKLRPGVVFSDGTPLKASDVVWSFIRAANDPEQHWTFTLTALERDADGKVKGIEAVDDSTVKITLPQPWAPFLADLAMFNMSVISEAWVAGDEKKLTEQALGTGPFTLKEWKKGDYILLGKNDKYWEEGLPLLDEVKVSVVPDDNARILQLQGGEIDGMYGVPFSRVEELKADPNLKVWQFPSTFSQYITLNTSKAPLDDVNARLALQYATDKQTLIDVVLFGLGIPATTLMPAGALFWNPNLEGFPYNLDKAKEELAKSKTPEGFPIEIQTLAGSADQETLATALKDMWAQIGVEVTITPTESSVNFENYQKGNFEAQINGWTNDIIDPDELISYAVLPDGSNAFGTRWTNDEAVKLVREGALELDPAKRQEIYYRIQEIYNQDSPMILLYHTPYLDVTTAKVHNFQQPPTGQWVWKKTWIEE